METEIAIVTVTDLKTGKRYIDTIDPYNKNVAQEQIKTLRRDLIKKNNLSEQDSKTEWEIILKKT